MITETVIKLEGGSTGFAENKDEARRIRISTLLPALHRHEHVTLDFAAVAYSTQSFIHALLGEVLQRFGEEVLKNIEFKNCTPQLKSIVELVVDYSFGGFQTKGNDSGDLTPQIHGPQGDSRKKANRQKATK
jgi:hypothetical protein